jgi:hypothetical protein
MQPKRPMLCSLEVNFLKVNSVDHQSHCKLACNNHLRVLQSRLNNNLFMLTLQSSAASSSLIALSAFCVWLMLLSLQGTEKRTKWKKPVHTVS